MIKKYTIKKEKYLELFPQPYLVRNDLRMRDGYLLGLGSSDFPERNEYKLKKVNFSQQVGLANSKLGCYEFTELSSRHEYRFSFIPDNYLTIQEIPGPLDALKPTLDKFMPNRWLIIPAPDNSTEQGSEYLYLYYPEFVITNTLGEQHTIKEMVIQLVFDEHGCKSILRGKRFAFTKQELYLGYSHSHLDTRQADSTSDRFNDFCVGESQLKKFMATLNGGITADHFELLLVQLEQYLVWESIEGRPYISISTLFTNSSTSTESKLGSNARISLAKKFLDELTPEMLFALDDYTWILNPGMKDKALFELEKSITNQEFKDGVLTLSKLYDFDTETGSYEADVNRYEQKTLPSALQRTAYTPILNAFNIVPYLYSTGTIITRPSVIKRIGQEDLTGIFQIVNELLTKGQTLNGQNNLSEESSSSDNRKTAVASNNIA